MTASRGAAFGTAGWMFTHTERTFEMRMIAVAALGVAASTAAWAGETPIELESSTKSQYFLVEKSGPPEQPELVLKRVRAGATTYLRQVFDCANQKTQTIGSAENLESLGTAGGDAEMYTVTDGSVAYALWKYACTKENAN